MDKRLHISAKNTTDLLPNERVLHAASAGGVDSPSQGARITVGIVNRIAPQNAMCKRWDTLLQTWRSRGTPGGLQAEELARPRVWAGPSQAHFFQPAVVIEELPCLDAQSLRHRATQHLGGIQKCIQDGLSWPCWHQWPPGTANSP